MKIKIYGFITVIVLLLSSGFTFLGAGKILTANPKTFQSSLNSLQAGQTLQLEDGVYKGNWVSPRAGTRDNPITIEPMHPGKVVIDGTLSIGNHQIWRDLDFTDSNPDRKQKSSGITMNCDGCKIIGAYIHDMHNHGITWLSTGEGEVKESWITRNGYYDLAGNGYGFGIYVDNNGNYGRKEINGNLIEHQLGKYGLKVDGKIVANLSYYWVHDNIFLHTATFVGEGRGLKDLIFERNMQVGYYSIFGVCAYSTCINTGIIQNNSFFDVSEIYIPISDFLRSTNYIYNVVAIENQSGFRLIARRKAYHTFIPFSESKRWAGIRVMMKDGIYQAIMVDRNLDRWVLGTGW